MNTLFVGIVIVIVAGWLSFAGVSSGSLFQLHSFSIVVLGTFGLFFMTSPKSVVAELLSSLTLMLKRESRLDDFKSDVDSLAINRMQKIRQDAHPLIAYASDLWNQGIDSELFIVLISQRRSDLVSRGVDSVHALRNLSKYPPALGMTGTVLGIVQVFYALDQNKETIGASLSTAMTATLLGLIVSNLVISPLADRLHVRQLKSERLCENLYELVLLINRGEPAPLIREESNARAA